MSGHVADAWREAEKWAYDDPTYAEIMSTLAGLGELLDLEYDDDTPGECRALVKRSITLGQLHGDEVDELETLWISRHMGAERE